MTAEQKTLFEDYLQKVNDTNSYIYQMLFCQGFKMGAEIVLEALK